MAFTKDFSRSRVIAQPKNPDKADQLRYALRRARRHRKKWVEPDDAYLILSLHFSVKSYSQHSYHAEASLEIPVENGFQYASIAKGSKTRAGALRAVITEIENSKWFHHMKKRKVYFKVTGAGMEELYRGYL